MSSWFWTTALSYALFCVVNNKPTIPDSLVHVVCWVIPIFTTFIQLIGGTYTAPSPRDTWCTFVAYSSTSTAINLFFNFGLYWCWYMLSVLIMTACGALVHYQLYFNPHAEYSDLIRRMYSKVVWYPVFMVVCWVIDLKNNEFGRGDTNSFAFFGMFAGACNGIITAIIFFLNSEEARSRWHDLMYPDQRSLSLLPSDFPVDFEDDDVYADDVGRSSCNTLASAMNSGLSSARPTTNESILPAWHPGVISNTNTRITTINTGIQSSTFRSSNLGTILYETIQC